MATTSQSKLNMWRSCRQAYHYAEEQQLELKKKPMPFLRGGIGHEMLDRFYKGKSPWLTYRKALRTHKKILKDPDYSHLPRDWKVIMEGYMDWFKREEIEVLDTEVVFEVPLAPGISLKGMADALIKDHRRNKKWIMETKFYNSIPSGFDMFFIIQPLLYAWGLEQCYPGIDEFEGVCWNFIWAKAPPEPELLKDGSLSKRKTRTTWSVYKEAIEKHGLKVADYMDMRKALRGNEAQYYVRQWLPKKPQVLEMLLNEAILSAQEIESGELEIVKSTGRHCVWCQYRYMCQAEVMGNDVSFIRKSQYRKKEGDHYGKSKKVWTPEDKQGKSTKRVNRRPSRSRK